MALPGVTTNLKDRFYTLSRLNVPSSPRVVAIAARTTADGTNGVANYDPYTPRTEKDAVDSFGLGSPAHKAYLEMIAGGAPRATIVALPTNATDASLYTSTVFDSAFDAAETVRPDIIVPWGRGGDPIEWEVPATPSNDADYTAVNFGFVADNTVGASWTNNLAKMVADKVKLISDRTHPCFAIMGVKPYVGSGAAATENILGAALATHLGMANLVPKDAPTFGDNGSYLSVVAAEIRPATYTPDTVASWSTTSLGYSNGAAVYAGALAQMLPWSASTGKPIFNIKQLRYNPTRTQLEALTVKGLVPVTQDFDGVATWVDGTTFGRSSSDYVRLSTLRIVFEAIQGIRTVAQSFIGEPGTLQTRNSLETAINRMLAGMQQVGALLSSGFTVSYIPAENKALVDLVLRPPFEIRNIDVSISVQL